MSFRLLRRLQRLEKKAMIGIGGGLLVVGEPLTTEEWVERYKDYRADMYTRRPALHFTRRIGNLLFYETRRTI